ncbi:type IV pilin protein [Vibrio bivalvicida]|uniref:Fimbrial protein n=1 Tax=Vibrio bivalvicida TaxID=1276888 RepID=A0A177XW60_9VIBR|nr:type IV pilin protein [Vibrio bivalvicida]OAJ92848.1 fimbrial protein [Vibrio bivalvicida]
MIRKILCNSRKNKLEAMTLIELLLTVAIISILAAVAYPSYQSHSLKAHRTTAIADMVKIQLELERQYQASYQSAASSVLYGGVCSFCILDSAQFGITISASKSSYTIKAQPLGSQLNDRCGGNSYNQLTLNQLGEMQPESCWQ